eukprot:scaffold23922_cov111-Skeletonema_dohrnii-CCMP3373.AAC.1
MNECVNLVCGYGAGDGGIVPSHSKRTPGARLDETSSAIVALSRGFQVQQGLMKLRYLYSSG